MRVLQVMANSTGGVGRHVAQVAAGLGDRFEIDVAAPAELALPMPKPVIPVDIPWGPKPGHVAAVARLVRLARSYDLVHAHGLRASLDAATAARIARVPCIVTMHNLIRPEIAGGRTAVYRSGERAVARLATRVVAVSREMRDRIVEAAPEAAGRVEVVYAAVGDPPPLSRPSREVRREFGADGRDLVVTAARLVPQKALHVMIEALALLDPRPLLVIAGSGRLEAELRLRTGVLGIPDDVTFAGFRSDVPDLVAAADVFCLSSIWEAVPLAIQESILLGTAVVSTAVGGVPELVEDGVTGWTVPPNDPRGLADALAGALSSAEERERRAAAALAALRERFAGETMFERLEELYREVGRG